MKKVALVCAVALVLGFAAPVLAGGVGGAPPDFSIAVASIDGGDHLPLTPSSTQNPDGSFSGTASGTTPSFSFSASFTVNAEPSLLGSFTLVNLSSALQIFTVGATLGGVTPIPTATTFHGSYGEANYEDLSGDGTVTFASPTLLAPGTLPFMTALIAGSQVAVIGAFSNTQTASGGSGPVSGTQGPELFGPSAGPAIPAVTPTIGTAFAFSLSPGDMVTVPFEFVVVPEPAGLASFAIGFALFLFTLAQKRASRVD